MNRASRVSCSKEMLKAQLGYGLIEWVFILLVSAFFLLLAFRVAPLYTENQFVITGLKDLVKADERLAEMTDVEIKKRMDNFYLVNNVRSEGPQNIEVDREDDKVVVKIDYEGKAILFEDQPFIGTVAIVVSFKNHLDSENLRLCCKPLKK